MSLQDLAKESILVQDACNLRAILRSFIAVIKQLEEAYPGKGDDFIFTHPIAQVWADKIASRCGVQGYESALDAHSAVQDIAEGK